VDVIGIWDQMDLIYDLEYLHDGAFFGDLSFAFY
jgi:hypothetical protein